MSESRSIDQIEYRWQPGTDMTPIATSMSEEWFTWWASRIGPWKRHPDVDSPTESVWYETFKGSGQAALAWRQRDPQAVPVTAESSSRPEVSRVLMGSADILTPRRAIALCAAGLGALGDQAGPPLGSFPRGILLSVITEEQLAGLIAAEELDKLDRAAAEEPGLEQLIAAALSDHHIPLAVELPEQLIARSLRDGPQARLLWGLSRTLEPLLGPSFGEQRTWSFSTFEPPLGATDPGALGAIVFRAVQAGQSTAPLAFRHERLVRPYKAVQNAAPTKAGRMAEWLILAYQSGGATLEKQLEECARDYQKPQQRVEAAYRMLERRFGEQVPVSRPESVTLNVDSPPSDLEAGRHRSTGPIPMEQSTTAPRPPARLAQLVAALSDGPESGTFASTLDGLSGAGIEYSRADRAEARGLLRERAWYVGTLGQHPRFHDILVAIFTQAVLPDLDSSEVERQLSSWAGPGGAPDQVIRALYKAGTFKQAELTGIMGPALGSRWLAENRISTVPPRWTPPRQAPPGQLQPNRGSAGRGPQGPASPGQGSPGQAGAGRRPDGPVPSAQETGSPLAAAPFAPEGKQPLLSRQRLLGILRRPVPLYVALALAIVVLILLLIV